MRVPSSPRRTGARNKRVHFQYAETIAGQPWEAYIAGPAWWGFLHMMKPSKPCVYEITAGAIGCRFCGKAPRPVAVMKGWVPLYRRTDDEACMVPVDEAQRDRIDALPLFSKVVVGRSRGGDAGVYVQPATNQEPKFFSTLPERTSAADVTETLLTVWGLPEVTGFFCTPSVNAVSLPDGTAVNDRGEVFSPMLQSAAKRAGADVVLTAAEESDAAAERDYLRGVQAGTIKPSTNGKHRAKKG